MKKNMTRIDFANKISKEIETESLHKFIITKDITLKVINKFLKEIENSIKNNRRVELRGFGVFIPVLRKQKIGRNFHDLDKDIIIPEKTSIKFKISNKLQSRLSKVKNEI